MDQTITSQRTTTTKRQAWFRPVAMRIFLWGINTIQVTTCTLVTRRWSCLNMK
ncbi:hypothetical protein CORC01_11589 [Colletotrichum orchidophilum]|uniref:Uncharacterized protein n=1 Tax=Colletotrichum orchidophilum TaxID=1209926 RepID=A0A1G4AVA1_9PEZI|nr:uncharacterized protein CORC01_11589 [Colletotrichum orchidophilum]OHE93100.1 hypothetical protein CORC01_11589 [Colletotrichum orchidophilum]